MLRLNRPWQNSCNKIVGRPILLQVGAVYANSYLGTIMSYNRHNETKTTVIMIGGLTTLGSFIWMILGGVVSDMRPGTLEADVGLLGFIIGVGVVLAGQLLPD